MGENLVVGGSGEVVRGERTQGVEALRIEEKPVAEGSEIDSHQVAMLARRLATERQNVTVPNQVHRVTQPVGITPVTKCVQAVAHFHLALTSHRASVFCYIHA